jgi:Kef-type K+ transport system membrane component KefB
MGWKIAPIYWWDGTKWHWAGTTASSKQLISIVLTVAAPIFLLNLAINTNIWTMRPEWLSPVLLSIIVAIITVQLIYLTCWDFNSKAKRQQRRLTEEHKS